MNLLGIPFRYFLIGLLCVSFVLGAVSDNAHASLSVIVSVDGRPLAMDAPPVIINGRTLVPLRAIFEALGATVTWDAGTNKVTGTRGATFIVLHLDSTTAYIDDVAIAMDIAPRAMRGRTFVPARFVAESLGATVRWNEGSRTIEITSPPRVSAVSINVPILSLNITDAPMQLTATASPANAQDQRVTWQSSEPNIAAVSDSGLVTPLAPGIARITAMAVDGGHTAVSMVTVLGVSVTGVTLASDHLTLPVGATSQLVPTLSPNNATNLAVTWASSDPTVVSVVQSETNTDGTITALNAGETTVTVTTQDGGFMASVRIRVVVAATGVVLDQPTLQLLLGRESKRLIATVQPANATNTAVRWSTSNPTVATVDQAGLVSPVGLGSTTIFVHTAEGDHSSSSEVTVSPVPIAGITLNRNELTLNLGNNVSLAETSVPTLTPTDATNRHITWTSSNPAVARVASNARIQAIAPGRATITATTQDGAFTATVQINVLPRWDLFGEHSPRPQFWYNGRRIAFARLQPFVCFHRATYYPLEELLGGMGIPYVWEKRANANDLVRFTYHGKTINITTSDAVWISASEWRRLDDLGYVKGSHLLGAMREAFGLSLLQMYENPAFKLFVTDWSSLRSHDEVFIEYIVYPEFRTREWLSDFLDRLYNEQDVSIFLIEHIPEAELAAIKTEVDKVIAGLSSDYERLRALSLWVATHIHYDFDALDRPQLTRNWAIQGSREYMIFRNRHGICYDYSRLLDAMLYIAGIPSRIMVSQDLYHAWNEAYVDGRWIFVDTTWNSRNQFRNGTFTQTQPAHWKYFDIRSPLVPIFIIP